MKRNFFTSLFHFNKSDRVGMLFLMSSILAAIYVSQLKLEPASLIIDFSSSEILAKQAALDSLNQLASSSKRDTIYRFNPNFMTDYRAYTLGIQPAAYDRLKAFRASGKWINSTADFQQVTGIEDSLLQQIAPLFKFPEWVNQPRKQYSYKKNFNKNLTYAQKRDLNRADTSQLQEIYGIGPALSSRIVSYRTKVGGFHHEAELYAVWGLRDEVIERITQEFTVKSPRPIERYNINTASASDLATIPGVSFELAKRIWEFVRLRQGVEDISEIKKIEGITNKTFRLIELYLFAG